MTKLEHFLQKINGCEFAGIDTETSVVLRNGKRNILQGRVTKVVTGSNVMLFSNTNSNGYENAVKKRLAQEGKDPESFQLSPRKWGQRISGTPFVQHNDKLYIEVIFIKAGTSKYLVDGVETDRNQIEGLETDKQEGEQGGLSDEKKVIIRTYSIDSIKRITLNKETHVF